MNKLVEMRNKVGVNRAMAQMYYKALMVTPDDPKLMQKYADAWQEYTKANTEMFLEECEVQS